MRLKEWSGLSESNQHLNLGKSAEDGFSRTYETIRMLTRAFISSW
jgi:hypothetical protein